MRANIAGLSYTWADASRSAQGTDYGVIHAEKKG